MRIGDDIIDRSAAEGVRVVALALLADADAAAERLENGGDDEALHDFRVALRRLRTGLRAFRPWLRESVARKHERRLRKYARATNAARDAEVHLAWLDSRKEALAAPRHGAGVAYLRAWIRAHTGDSGDDLVARYRKTSERISRRLETARLRGAADDAPVPISFAVAKAVLLRSQLHTVRESMGAVRGALDQERVHAARIAVKRLRYIVEPLRGNRHADASAAVKQLKRLQDVLGELHDSHVIGHDVEEALAYAEAHRARRIHAATYDPREVAANPLRSSLAASPRPGLLAVTRLVRDQREALFADFERDWRSGGIEALTTEIRAIAEALESRAGGQLVRSVGASQRSRPAEKRRRPSS